MGNLTKMGRKMACSIYVKNAPTLYGLGMRVPGQKKIVLQKGAIVSPLARDWIDFDGIEIVYE